MTWLASLEGGAEVLAEADTLEDLFEELNKLDLHDDTRIVVMHVGGDGE